MPKTCSRVISYATAKSEKSTYNLMERSEKEKIPEKEILAHWEARAERSGIQSVMSARHTIAENAKATKALKKDIIKFLEGKLEDRSVLEFGCGIGRMTEDLAKKAKQVIAIDFSPKMIKRAKKNLKGVKNVGVKLGRITDFEFKPKAFDLIFESIVLLHILNPKELKKTAEKMKQMSDIIFICEHTYESPNFPISRYSILRKPEEYKALFRPFKLIKQKMHICAGDKFTLMLFKNKQAKP